MQIHLRSILRIYFFCFLTFLCLTIFCFVRLQNITPQVADIGQWVLNKIPHSSQSFETTVQCLGHSYNQSCLFKNLYYINSTFMILTVKGSYLPSYSVRTNAFSFRNTIPSKYVFNTYSQLERFVRDTIRPKVIPSLTLYFDQLWHFNIGHALFNGLYPVYVGLLRFSSRHLQPFRILAGISDCNSCASEDVYSRFAGLGILKLSVLNKMSKERWFMFDELVMGGGTMCQRCNQPNLQLPGGVEMDASRLFRDRMYRQHGLIPTVIRKHSSSEYRTSRDILQAYIIDNKRFTKEDRKELNRAIDEINNYTLSFRNQNTTKLRWPLINVTYLYYNHIRAQNKIVKINITRIDARSPIYELIDNTFIAQLKILQQMDIHISGPGTGQMYQTFLSDGSIHINLGGLRPRGLENTDKAFTSFLEQHMTSGTPYIKGLYYPINERVKGIKKDEVVKLIREAGRLILKGFSLPVNPQENLAADGRLFVEMCEKDKEFCSFVTIRSPNKFFACVDLWVEDLVHENNQWALNGTIKKGRMVRCPFNRTLLYQLRLKYGIKHKSKT